MNRLRSSSSSGLSRRDAIRHLSATGAATTAAVVSPHLARANAADDAAPEHQAAVERLFVAINSGDYNEMDAFIAPDHVFHTCGQPKPIVGLQALKMMLANVRVIESSTPYVLEAVMATGDQVAARWTRLGPTIDPEKMRVTEGTTIVEGQFICRFRGEQLVETWNVSFARNADETEDDD